MNNQKTYMVCTFYLWVVLVVSTGKKTRKRKAAEPTDLDEEVRKKRSLEDWAKLPRQALDLVIAELSVDPRDTDEELADRIYHHYQGQVHAQQTNTVEATVEGNGVQPSATTQFNELRDELYSVIATQLASITHDLSQQISQVTARDSQNRPQPPINSASQISPLQNQLPSQPPDATPQLAAPQQHHQQVQHNNINNVNYQHTTANLFRMPVLSSQNLNLIKNGKFVNFDYLLPGSLAHTSSGYSIQFHQSAGTNGIDSDTPFSLQPQTGCRTIKSVSTRLSAWNVFFQAFCFSPQHLLGVY